MILSNDLFPRFAVKFLKGRIASFNGVVCVEDQNAIRSRIEERIETLLFIGNLSVKPRIVNRDCGLICKGLEQYPIVRRKKAGVVAKDEDDANYVFMCHKWKCCPIEQSHAGGIR